MYSSRGGALAKDKTELLWLVLYLHRGDGPLLSGGNSLLHGTHVSGQGGLVTHSRGDTTQQGRHLERSLSILTRQIEETKKKKKKHHKP